MTLPASNLASLSRPEFPVIERKIRHRLDGEPALAALDDLPLADGRLEQEIARSVEEILNQPLEDVLVAGWKKWSEIRRHAGATRTEPGVTHVVPLAEHDLVSAHKPTIRVLLNDAEVATIAFDLTLKFHLSGFRLTIRDGAIHSAKTGAARLSVELSFKGQEIWSHRFDEIALPGQFDFEPPIEV